MRFIHGYKQRYTENYLYVCVCVLQIAYFNDEQSLSHSSESHLLEKLKMGNYNASISEEGIFLLMSSYGYGKSMRTKGE